MDFNENLIRNSVNLCAKFEGLRLSAYKDVSGYLTIGYGHRLLPNESYRVIDKQTAVELLVSDFRKHLDFVHRLFPRIFGVELYALACFDFNCHGSNWFDENKNLGRECKAFNKWYSSASFHEEDIKRNIIHWMLAYNKATVKGQKVELDGLSKRRQAEVSFFKGNLDYYTPKNTQQIKL